MRKKKLLVVFLDILLKLHKNMLPPVNVVRVGKEFIINPYLKLRFKNNKTIIYVNGEPFNQCMYLLINVTLDNKDILEEIDSIDEVAIITKQDVTPFAYKITPEVEFSAHCSNLQVWYEQGYNTKLLHRNLAFPLLRKLADAGDPLACKMFKDEIAIRFSSKFNPVMTFLINEGYLNYLNIEEKKTLLSSTNINFVSYHNKCFTIPSNNYLDLSRKRISSIVSIENLPLFSNLKGLSLSSNKISKMEGIENLQDLEFLNLSQNSLSKIEGVQLKHLKWLRLGGNRIKKIENLDSLEILTFLDLCWNQITKIEGLKDLLYVKELLLHGNKILKIENLEFSRKLEKLTLSSNDIEVINGLDNLTELKILNLGYNKITRISGLEKLLNLEVLDLRNNDIRTLAKLSKLKNLKELYLPRNPIREIKGIRSLKKLEVIDLCETKITEVPEWVSELPHLKKLKLHKCEIINYPILSNENVIVTYNEKEAHRFHKEFPRKKILWRGNLTVFFKQFQRELRRKET